MDCRRMSLLAGALLTGLMVMSCHHDDDDTTVSNSFTGTLDFTIPAYVLPGDIVEAEPRGLAKDTVDKGYYWTVTPIFSSKDTTRFIGDDPSVTGRYSFEVPDTLGTLTVSCVAFAPGYYTSTASYYCEVVNPAFGKTLTGDDVSEDMAYVEDGRDGKLYYYRKIGARDWFVRNLSYEGAGISFYDCPALDDIYGRYYTWDEAVEACPEGWRLPGADDWYDLAKAAGYAGDAPQLDYLGIAGNLMVNAYFNGTRMWEYWPAVKITNRTGFSSIPTGYSTWTSDGSSFYGSLTYAVYWSAETVAVPDDEEEQALYRMIYVEKPDIMAGSAHKTGFNASVRCVRNVTE